MKTQTTSFIHYHFKIKKETTEQLLVAPAKQMIFLHSISTGNCNSKEIPRRIECGWPNITKEQCLARDCCYDSTYDKYTNDSGKVYCFVQPHLGE